MWFVVCPPPQIENSGCAYVFMCIHVIYMRSCFYLHLFRHLTYCIIEKNSTKNELILKGHSSQKFFARFSLKKFNKSVNSLHQIWAFYDLPLLRYNRLDFSLYRFLSIKILPRLPIGNKILKSYGMFLIFNKCFAVELLSKQSKDSEL